MTDEQFVEALQEHLRPITGEIDDDLHRRRRLVRVRIRPPAQLDQHARTLARPLLAGRPHVAGAQRDRVSVAQAAITHRSAVRRGLDRALSAF